jgi:hypothetical protein
LSIAQPYSQQEGGIFSNAIANSKVGDNTRHAKESMSIIYWQYKSTCEDRRTRPSCEQHQEQLEIYLIGR